MRWLFRARAAMPPRPNIRLKFASALCIAVAIAGCASRPQAPTPPSPPPPEATPSPPMVTRGEFTIEAEMLDTWIAVGQIAVRTNGVTYENRAQMLGLYSLRYRDERLLVFTRALLLSDTIRNTTTLVTATSPAGKPIDSDAAAELLALLQRELPAEIERVRAQQAEERKAKARKAKRKET
jgi:hypothetical protein